MTISALTAGAGLFLAGAIFMSGPAAACGTAEMWADGFARAEDNDRRTRMLENLIDGCDFYVSKTFEPDLLDILNEAVGHGLDPALVQRTFAAYRCIPSAFVNYRPGDFPSEAYKALAPVLDYGNCPGRAEIENWRVVTGDYVNFRAAPSIGADRLGSFRGGAIVEFAGTEGEWTKVTAGSGRTGYVHSDFVAPYVDGEAQAKPQENGDQPD